MKKLFMLFAFIVAVSSSTFGQFGYTTDFYGEFNYRDLTNPENTNLIGTTITQVDASDFDLNNILYAISGNDNGLYQINTSDASATLIGNAPPSGGEVWTGMACDPTDGTMYICSTNGNSSSFYTIDLTNASTSFVGSNSEGNGVVGIAFDDGGQMYAIYLVRMFYMIDKTNATPTFVGNLFEAVTAIPHHGLDFDPVTQTMFMVSYNAFSFDNELWTIDISNGSNTLIGSVGTWTGSIAVEPESSIEAGFSADTTELCDGETVSFTDESTGNPVSWLWTFEGGTPLTSSEQNPLVTYTTPGTFDVTLEVSDGTNSSSLLKADFINVLAAPAPEISGTTEVCEGDINDYSTAENTGNSYEWIVEGGTLISGMGTSQITVQWGSYGTGYVIVTESSGDCATTTDQYVVTILNCLTITDFTEQKVSFFPNPVKDWIHISSGDLIKDISIYDYLGKLQISEKVDNKTYRLNVSEWNSGIYIIEANTSNYKISEKIIKK